MLKALKDFTYASVEVKAGDVIKPGTFEADQVADLLAQGLVADTSYRKPDPVVAVKIRKEHK